MKRITALTIVTALRAAEKYRDIYTVSDLKLYNDLELLGLVHARGAVVAMPGQRRSKGAFVITGTGKAVVGMYATKMLARRSALVESSTVTGAYAKVHGGKSGH
jgi:hypothetical protein